MMPDDIFISLPEPAPAPFSDADVFKFWPGARGELAAFARHLRNHGSAITAEQLVLALALADESFARRKERASLPDQSGGIDAGQEGQTT